MGDQTSHAQPAAIELRGETVEGRHPFSAVYVDAGGVQRWGPPLVTTWRSAAKPFQLAVSLRHLGGHTAYSEVELAVGTASHSGEPRHLAVVDRLLARHGLRAADLRCGAHPPIHEASSHAWLRQGGRFDPRHNNCSGKHAFMAAAAAASDAGRAARPAGDYREATHPLQRELHDAVSGWCGEAPALAVDGCGIPTFCLSLGGMARAWQTLALAMAGDGDETLGRIARAMADRADLSSGTGRLDADLVGAAREPLAAKVGGRAVFCVALPRRGAGLAVKVHSGNMDALGTAVPAALARFAPGALSLPQRWPHAEVRNVVGRKVGRWVLADDAAAG